LVTKSRYFFLRQPLVGGRRHQGEIPIKREREGKFGGKKKSVNQGEKKRKQ